MFTKKIKDTFSVDLLNAVSGILGEAKKKCAEDCECEACSTEESDEDETNEGYVPTNDLPDAHSRKVAGKLGAMLKREREAKEKKETNGVKTEAIDPDLESELKATRQTPQSIAKWNVVRNGKTVSSHTSKDAADVKAMKHPSNKVRAEEADINSEFNDLNEKLSKSADAGEWISDFEKSDAPQFKGKSKEKRQKMALAAYYSKKNEEVELDEAIDTMSDARIKYHATTGLPHGRYTPKEIKAEHERRRKSVPNYHAVKASLGEEAEQIDELSKGTLGSYIKKAAGHAAGSAAATAAIASSSNPKVPGKVKRDLRNRLTGISKATDKLTKEEQEFIDSLNADTLDEARGRPKKAGGKDYTIHPKTKEKLMHSNPEHMARLEKLQKHGVIAKPKTEANQHIITQLQRAKTSMRGGETVHFTHGDSHHVAGGHAAKLLDKYAGMKPNEKEAFQKKIGHSHENLKSEL